MKMRRATCIMGLLLLLTVVACPVGQCVTSESMFIDELEKELGPVPKLSKKYVIGVVLKSTINEFWQDIEKGYKETGEEYGVELIFGSVPTEQDVVGQLDLTETMINRNVDALLVSPLTANCLIPALERAYKKGIPIINVGDAQVTEVPTVTYLRFDEYQTASSAAELMAKTIGSGKVMCIEGLAGATITALRRDGFVDKVKTIPQLELVASLPGNWDRTMAMNAVLDTMKVHPDLKGVFTANDTMALGALAAVESLGKSDQVFIIGIDGTDEAKAMIKEGRRLATFDANPTKFASIALELALRHLEGQTLPKEVKTEYKLILQ
ncbi:MAG: substrate-binding domain-containing protein [Firmicutes bacterium]|jgi:ABC-type sugar transport system substrate-binding protein|nr:substrate-binding domain-containing protein [Bacillota bacterium]